MRKYKTQSQRIIDALRAGAKTTDYFIDELRIFKYSSRIADLRRKGYVIEAKNIRRGLWRYTLVGEPEEYTSSIVHPNHITRMELDKKNHAYLENKLFNLPVKKKEMEL